MDAILYIRFSTAEQKTGDSYDRQRRDGLAYIEKMGWRHTATIEDLGKSAWKGEHMLSTGALGKLSAEVAAGDIGKGTVIVAEKTDRLSREGWEPLFDWLRDMTRRGVSVATTDGHLFSPETMKDQLSIIKILLGGQAEEPMAVHHQLLLPDRWDCLAHDLMARSGQLVGSQQSRLSHR